MENILNNFLFSLQEELKNIEENNKGEYILYKVNSLLKNTNNNIFLKNNFTNLLAKNNIDAICKIEYNNKARKIILVTQYYKTDNEKRSKENNVCLLNNILNDNIDKIILLNEEEYDLNFLFNKIDNKYRKKVKQINIETRLRYYDAFNYVNTYYKNNIIIVANLDIFFDNNLNKLKEYDLTNKFFSISRYDLKNDYNFNGHNEIQKFTHDGSLGNPCIDSADTWIFEAPINHGDKTKIMLGANGCDTAINYIMKYDYKYDVYNPINSIITIHYHLMSNKERENYNKNSIMTYGDKIYNTKKEFKPSEVNHLYLNHKTIKLCNKIESFCTFATKSAYKDLRLLLHSLELYHKDVPIFIICDKWINDKIENDKYDLIIHKKIDLEKYTDLNRQQMEERNIFTEFLLYKAKVIDYAMNIYNNTLFIDSDIVILNKMDLLIDIDYDVGLSPHNIFEENQKKFGIYNAGFMYVANKNITKYWIHIINTTNTFDDQQALDYFEEKFKVFRFDDSYNYGWWRLFQCENPQKRANLFTYDENNVYYEYKTLKCIHTHLYQNNDKQTISFNNFILELLVKIKHPMIKFIMKENKESVDIKPSIIIPKMPRNDFWNHAGDTFRELVTMWKQQNLCNIIEGDTKHVWFNKIGDVLLYDRPTLEWLDKDNNLKYNKILFGNPEIPDKLKDKAYNWIFWGRRPAILEEMSKNILSYNERIIKSIFIGKIENAVQNKYRTIEDWDKYVEVYKMHLPNEKYIYTQDEYLHLLKKSKFGLSIRGYGPKCNREIELMALGTVPIIDNNVNMDYHNKPIENIHYFRINKPEEIVKIIDNCSEKQWTEMSNACIKWYNDNCSCIGSFNVTMDIINSLKKNKETEKKNLVNNKSKINSNLFGVQNLLLNIN